MTPFTLRARVLESRWTRMTNRQVKGHFAHSANLPEGLCILLALISFFLSFLMIARKTIISGSAGSIFAIFSLNESVLGLIDLDLFFRYLKGRCHGNQFCGKIANSPHSSLWHYETEWAIATSISHYQRKWCLYIVQKFRELWSSNSRVDRAHLWTSGTTRQKTGVFSRIIVDRFLQYFHHMKANMNE